MKSKELRQKTKEELLGLLDDGKVRLEELRFLLSQKKVKNINESKQVKKDIARISTILKESGV